MANRSRDWLRQAEADLQHAGHARNSGDFDWSCFAAHQAAEKGVKSVILSRSAEAWGHSVTRLVAILAEEGAIGAEALLDDARLLDRHYIPTRYPDNLPDGAPTDFYREADAAAAIDAAGRILDFCRRQAR